jgi:glycosyltransferase involved in cell wall biosynthesis
VKIAIVLERPTQFDVPLFRHAAGDPDHALRVLYVDPAAARPAFDPELGRRVAWGGDPLAGYDARISPSQGANRWLRRELGDRNDLVVVNGYTKRSYLAANAAARRAGSATALRLDSVPFDEGPAGRRLAKRVLFRLVVRRLFRLFLGAGSSTLDYLRGLGVPAERAGLFPYPVDVEGLRALGLDAAATRSAARARLGLGESAPVVLAVAKLHPRETPWDLLHAWARTGVPDRWLLIAGDGPDRPAVEAFLSDHAVPRVRLLGYVPYPELPALFTLADVFVHAPREERWGVSVAEALCCGRPVVACDRVGAARDLVRAGGNGFTYPARDPDALAARIDDALRLPAEAIEAANREILPDWGLAATWARLIETAARERGR